MWYFLVYLSLSHTVSWVRCGTSLYWFLIFVFFPTLSCTGLSACLVINPIICYRFSFPFVCTTVGQRQHWHYKYISWVWGWDKKSIQRITIWHHEACWVMTNGDHEWHIFYHTLTLIMNFFSCSPQNTSFYIGKTWTRLPGNPEYSEMRHGDVVSTFPWRHGWTCGCSFFIVP